MDHYENSLHHFDLHVFKIKLYQFDKRILSHKNDSCHTHVSEKRILPVP